MNQLFNISPLALFNVQRQLTEQQTVVTAMQNYMKGSGFDVLSTAKLNETNKKQVINKNEAVPRWFPLYFKTSLSRQLNLPYTTQSQDPGGLKDPNKSSSQSMVDTFKRNSFANPADVFPFTAIKPGTLSGADASKLRGIIQDALSFKGRQSISDLQSSQSDFSKISRQENTTMINGNTHQSDDGVFKGDITPPSQLEEANERFKNVMAEVMPFTDREKTAQLINFMRGRDENGYLGGVSQRAMSARFPSLKIAQQVTDTKPGNRTSALLGMVGAKIKQQQSLPGTNRPYAGSTIVAVQNIAAQQKFFKKNLMEQRRQLMQSRFE